MDPENYSEGPEFDGSERHYIGSLLDEDASSPKKQERPPSTTSSAFPPPANYSVSDSAFLAFSDNYTSYGSSSASFPAPESNYSSTTNNVGPSPNQSFWPEPPPPYSPPMGQASMTFGGWDGAYGQAVPLANVANGPLPSFYNLDPQYYDQCYSSLMKPFDGVTKKYYRAQQYWLRKSRSRNQNSQSSTQSASVSTSLGGIKKNNGQAKQTQTKKESAAFANSNANGLSKILTQKPSKTSPNQPKNVVVGWNPIETDPKTPKSAPTESSSKLVFKAGDVKRSFEFQRIESKRKMAVKQSKPEEKKPTKKSSGITSRSSSNDTKVHHESRFMVLSKNESKEKRGESLNSTKSSVESKGTSSSPDLEKAKLVQKCVKPLNKKQENGFAIWFLLQISNLIYLTSEALIYMDTCILSAFRKIGDFSKFLVHSVCRAVCNIVFRLFHVFQFYLDYLVECYKVKLLGCEKVKYPGLDWNVPLPLTVHDAINRIVALPKLDPYSVLGLRKTASLEEIKQAKNSLTKFLSSEIALYPGVEVAISLINDAWSLLDTEDKRKNYSTEEVSVVDSCLLYNYIYLRNVIFNAEFYMGCECGGAHKVTRIQTGADPRFCRRCQTFHSVRNCDVWMERTWFGFFWNCFACIDNATYDITAWVACPSNFIKNPKIETHAIHFVLKKSDIRQSLTLDRGVSSCAKHCSHKISSAYCVIDSTGRCVRCERCLICHQKPHAAASGDNTMLLGLFEVVPIYSNSADLFTLERPKKAGRRR